jgi:hypothetical protein
LKLLFSEMPDDDDKVGTRPSSVPSPVTHDNAGGKPRGKPDA